MPVLFPKRLKGWRFVLFNLVLGLGHAVVLFGAGAYIALLPHVAGNLGGVLPSFGTWAQTDFMIALALAFPVARWLGCRVGEYRLFIGAFVGYAVASYLCGASDNLATFLPARLLLGFAGGLTLPIGQALLLNEYPDRRKPLGLAIWGVFTLLPFTVGFPFGGWLADEVGWRALFYVNVPVALIIAGVTGALLYRRGFESTCRPFDAVGFILLAVILGGIQTILNQGNDYDWFDSPFLRHVLIVVVIAVPCFIIWELGEVHPALDLGLFRHRNFVIGVIGLAAGFFSLQGVLSLFIVQLQLLMGYSSTLAGLVFLPMLLLGAPVICVMHELAKRVDARLLASLNLMGLALTFYWIGLFDDPHSFDQIFWPMIVEGVFLGSFFTPLTVLTLHGLTGDQMLRAAETVNLVRIAAGAFGITSQGVVLFRRTPFHQMNLADHFGGRISVSFDGLTDLTTKLEHAGVGPGMVEAKLHQLIKQEAAILALDDAFLLAAYLCAGLAVFVWLAHSTRRPVPPPAQEELREWRAEELMEQP
ncbi:DHA2 family efflux MFS transporter permease subunit [Candidatus Nitrospira bockiana]